MAAGAGMPAARGPRLPHDRPAHVRSVRQAPNLTAARRCANAARLSSDVALPASYTDAGSSSPTPPALGSQPRRFPVTGRSRAGPSRLDFRDSPSGWRSPPMAGARGRSPGDHSDGAGARWSGRRADRRSLARRCVGGRRPPYRRPRDGRAWIGVDGSWRVRTVALAVPSQSVDMVAGGDGLFPPQANATASFNGASTNIRDPGDGLFTYGQVRSLPIDVARLRADRACGPGTGGAQARRLRAARPTAPSAGCPPAPAVPRPRAGGGGADRDLRSVRLSAPRSGCLISS
jgi:hypothetical protein